MRDYKVMKVFNSNKMPREVVSYLTNDYNLSLYDRFLVLSFSKLEESVLTKYLKENNVEPHEEVVIHIIW